MALVVRAYLVRTTALRRLAALVRDSDMGMLKITILDSAAELRFRLEGRLSGPWVGELRQCWRTAASTVGERATVVDLGEVDFIDPEGHKLIAEMHEQGMRLLAATPLIQAMVDEITRPVAGGDRGAAVSDCGRVEKERSRRADALLQPHTPRHDSRTL
jgi:hypothetical protein